MFYGDTSMTPPPYVISSPDAPFSQFSRVGSTSRWKVGMEDRIAGDWFGFDADTDLVFIYDAPKGAKATTSILMDITAGDDFKLLSYTGKTIFANVKQGAVGKKFTTPLLWGSFGMNIAGGYRNTKGNPILLTEYATWGAFPEKITNLHASGTYGPDDLSQKLRLRHGGNARGGTDALLRDPADPTYVAKSKANCGFQDGHVERLGWERLKMNNSPLWLGNRGPGFQPTF
jgi:prepilin-type processing-associated H-X9-DG protein